jgi:hypothetical protein
MYVYVYYRKAWIALGDMTKLDCQLEIIKLLETIDSQMEGTILEKWRARQSNEEKEKPRCVLELHSTCKSCTVSMYHGVLSLKDILGGGSVMVFPLNITLVIREVLKAWGWGLERIWGGGGGGEGGLC